MPPVSAQWFKEASGRDATPAELEVCQTSITVELNQGDSSNSHIGGLPRIAQDKLPLGKDGRSLLFLGQIDFSEVPAGIEACPTAGVLCVFINRALDLANPKDRFSFSLVWHESSASAPPAHCEAVLPASYAMSFSRSVWSPAGDHRANHYLFGSYPQPQYSQAKEISAFAANGVSWNSARAQDSCYSHLVEASASWLLLWKLPDPAKLGWSREGHDLLVLINSSDLASSQLNRARLVCSSLLKT